MRSYSNEKIVMVLVVDLFLAVTLMTGCSGETDTTGELSGTLPIFHAGSLAVPFEQVSEEFFKLYPNVEILAEGAGSQATIKKVTELDTECGVIGSADYAVIPELMFPDYADWYIIIAANQMVLTYTHQSQFGDEITADNWFEVLQREGVTYGQSNPDQDPCGYRTLMLWLLAEDHYGVSDINNNLFKAEGDMMRPKSVDLISLLETGNLDYAFEYSSVATQHRLNYIVLPPEINLSQEKFDDLYATAEVEISDKEPGEKIVMQGKSIVYGVTILSNFAYKELAIIWIDFLLSPAGMEIIEVKGQQTIVPGLTNDKSKLREQLQQYVKST